MSEAVLNRLRSALGAHYQVERELGEGGAATVYLARDLKHQRNVAIKVFKPELAETLGAERFTREIRTAANLHHPHILTVLDSGIADGLLYYVMPFAEGESLRARITREGGLPIADVIRVLREVADALAAAHAAGVVHRDIKPDNVLLAGRHALVADFGVAKAVSESTGRNSITTVGVALGTPAYMAPEQAAADPHVDHRADVYALGVMGYEMLTGEPPFVRRTPQEVLAAHVTEPAPLVSARRASVPPAIDALIAKCLQKQAADRYQGADEIVAELERVATPTAGMSPAAGVLPTSARPGVATPRSSGATRRIVGVLVAAAVVVAGWFGVTKVRGAGGGDPNVVAVIPFEFSGTQEHAYLREGIVNLLEANFTGEGSPRAVASQTMIAQWKRRQGAETGLTDVEAREVAGVVGAGLLLRGSIVAVGSDLVISATLASARDGSGAVQAQVKGHADSAAVLASSLASQLIAVSGRQTADRAVTLQAVPAPALRAYLEGQAAFRAAEYAKAVELLDRALTIDSTFALAAMSLAQARGMGPTTFGVADRRNLGQIAYDNRDKLGPRDLTLLKLTDPGRFWPDSTTWRSRIAIADRLVREIPDRTEAWYLVGDRYLHYGEVAGFSRTEAMTRATQAFSEALRLDPGIEYIKSHLADMLVWQGEFTAHARLVDSLQIKSLHHRVIRAMTAGDAAEVARMTAGLDAMSADDQIMLTFPAFATGDSLLADALSTRLSRMNGSVADRQAALRWVRTFEDMAGRPTAAARVQARLRELETNGAPQFPTEDLFLAIFGDGDRQAGARAASRFASTVNVATAAGQQAAVQRAWALALWARHIGDSAAFADAVQRATRAVRSSEMADPSGLYRGVAELMAAMDNPPLTVVARVDSALAGGPPFGHTAIRMSLNLFVAQAWDRLGNTQKAAAAARRTGGIDQTFSSVQQAANRERGRLLLAVGDTAEAMVIWQAYIKTRNRAEPSQRALDEPIRAKLAELERKKR